MAIELTKYLVRIASYTTVLRNISHCCKYIAMYVLVWVGIVRIQN